MCGISCDQAGLEQTEADLGLNDPIPIRYANWLKDALTGDMGSSALNKQPVSEAIKERLPVTLELLVYSQFIALVVAIPMGLIAAQRSGGIFDRVSTTVAFGFSRLPSFVVAIVPDPDLRGEARVVPCGRVRAVHREPGREHPQTCSYRRFRWRPPSSRSTSASCAPT